MQSEVKTQPVPFSAIPPSYDEVVSPQSQGTLPCCVSEATTTDSKLTQRCSDNYYKHDLLNGTTIDERKVGNAAVAWLITGVVLFFAAYITLMVISVIIPIISPLFILTSLACPAVVGIGSAIFFSDIHSKNSKKHAQQVLGPGNQEKANALQCQAMDWCRKKQLEINVLVNENKRHESHMIELEKDAIHENELYEQRVIDERPSKTRLEQVSKAYRSNEAIIARKEKEIDRMSQIYCLGVRNDKNGLPIAYPLQAPNPDDLPK